MSRPLLALVSLLGLLAVACAGGDDGDDAPQPTAALSPVAMAESPPAVLPCQVPEHIKSFRVSLGMKTDMPGLKELREEFEEAIRARQEEQGADPFAELTETDGGLGGLVTAVLLLADVRVEGAFVAPDRTEVRARFLGELELTTITIGDREWTKRGALDWEESTAEPGGLTLTRGLADLCEGFTIPEVTGLEPREETVNGVATLHYQLDAADFRHLAELFAGDVEGMWDVENLPQEGAVDLWLAKEGNWPVQVEGDLTFEDEQVGHISLSLFMEIKDLNDPTIKIEPPPGYAVALETEHAVATTAEVSPVAGAPAGPGVPMFRGNPARTGVNPGPGVERSPELLWRFRTRGPVESSPAVVGSVVYIGSFDHYVYALDAATGQLLWRFQTDGPVVSSPTAVEGMIYVGSQDDYVYALDATTGALVWRFETDDTVWSSPAVVDGAVYIGALREVYALDAGTGGERWRFHTGRIPFFSPAVVDGVVYIGSWDSGVYALDAATGDERWHFDMDGVVGSSPAVVDGVVYIGREDGYVYALDASTGEERWRSKTGSLSSSSPAVADGVVYIGSEDGYVHALDAVTGRERWRFESGGAIGSSPTVVDRVIYIGSSDAYLYALDADTGEERWRFKIGLGRYGTESSPVVVDGVVYIGSDDEYVYAVTEE